VENLKYSAFSDLKIAIKTVKNDGFVQVF